MLLLRLNFLPPPCLNPRPLQAAGEGCAGARGGCSGRRVLPVQPPGAASPAGAAKSLPMCLLMGGLMNELFHCQFVRNSKFRPRTAAEVQLKDVFFFFFFFFLKKNSNSPKPSEREKACACPPASTD